MPGTRRRRRVRRALLAFASGLAVAGVLAELTLRAALFRDGLAARWLGAAVREAGWFADPSSDDEYWKLQHRLADASELRPVPNPDPALGWTGTFVTPGTYAQVDAERVGGRTPVLLYGDSFAMCVTPRSLCFQAILEESALGARYALVNYGVGGYGLDQIYLLAERSLGRWAAAEPVVIVAILVESDLDRSVLSFRGWPKPRLQLEDGELRAGEAVLTDPEQWLARHPPAIASYLLRFLTYRPGLLPAPLQRALRARHERRDEKVALNRAILAAIEAGLEGRGLRHFFYLFHDYEGLVAGGSWQESLIREVCAGLGAPVVDSRPFLVAAAGGSPEDCAVFYDDATGHLTALGNRVAFEGMRQGLLGRFGPADTARIREELADGRLAPELERPRERELLGRAARVVQRSRADCVREDAGGLWLRAGELGPTVVRFALDGNSLRLRAAASLAPGAARNDGLVTLQVRVDGRLRLRPAHP